MSYQFASYRLDLESRKLYQSNTVVSDDGKVVQLLQALCHAYPDVVDKQRLIDALWPDQVVTEGALSRIVSSTRKLLGDSGKDQSFIKTVRNRGFRLNTQVEKLAEETTDTLTTRKTKSWIKYRLLIPLATIALVLAVVFISLKPSQLNTLPEFPLRIAVLPITNELQTPVDEWVKYGVMSLVSEQLGRYEALQTLPVETIIKTLDGIEQNIEQESPADKFVSICERLGCSHLVVIKYRLEDLNQVVFSYQIVSQNHRSPISEFRKSGVVDAVEMLLDYLAPALIPGEIERLSLKDTISENSKANRDYIIGVHELLAGDYVAAKIYLELAISRVPSFFWAEAYLAKVELKGGNATAANELIDHLEQTSMSEKQSHFLRHIRADILYTQGNIVESLEVSIQLLKNSYTNTNPILMGNELQNIGSSYLSLGNIQLAKEYLTRALKQYQLAEFGSGKGKVLYNMGNVFSSAGENQKALEYYQKAKEIFIKHRLTGYTLMAKHMIASTGISLGKIQYAERELRSLIEDYKKNGNLEGELRVWSDLVEISMSKNDNLEANIRNEKLLARLESTDLSSLKNHALAIGVMCNLKLKNISKAEEYFERINNQWNDIRPAFILLSAYIEHEKGNLESAVRIANNIKVTLGKDWNQTHQMILDQFDKSLLAGKTLEIIY